MSKETSRLRSKARVMDTEEIQELLSLPIIARMATVGDSRPHIAPVWFEWNGGCLWITADKSHKKIANLRSNPHLAVSIDESYGGLRFWAIVMEGVAELIEEPVELVMSVTERIYGKYMGRGTMNLPTVQTMRFEGDPILIRMNPERIISWNAADSGIGPIG
jgi:nitroimidazol reductase NimA-like FMN-containing flavoprotein (pyridoxamine 5'-phosphate oxidase superfamily)